MELGLDSLDVVQFISKLNEKVPSLELQQTIVFEKPNVRELTKHVHELSNRGGAKSQPEPYFAPPASMPPARCRLPMPPAARHRPGEDGRWLAAHGARDVDDRNG